LRVENDGKEMKSTNSLTCKKKKKKPESTFRFALKLFNFTSNS
jgi:hypothetical protein